MSKSIDSLILAAGANVGPTHPYSRGQLKSDTHWTLLDKVGAGFFWPHSTRAPMEMHGNRYRYILALGLHMKILYFCILLTFSDPSKNLQLKSRFVVILRKSMLNKTLYVTSAL